tara:strand:+ start:16416 stop:17975 length:1560 start_codon:yes stop_codon:yes gene_type:complete
MSLCKICSVEMDGLTRDTKDFGGDCAKCMREIVGEQLDEWDLEPSPYDHQRYIWDTTKDDEGFAYFWEMGCAKTAPTIWTAAHLFLEGEIDCLLVLAPNGVHANWTVEEIPEHMPKDVLERTRCMTWFSKKAKNKATQTEFAELLQHEGLAVLVASYDAIKTELGGKAIKALLEKRKCLYVLDESGRIKTPGSKLTKRVTASAKYAKHRRILTGTPIDNSPMDIYTQVRFIRPEVWTEMGIKNYSHFKSRFGIWEQRKSASGGRFEALVRYRDLPLLKSIAASVGDRRLKSEVLDLPDKIYQRRSFDLNPEQRRIYKALEDEYHAELADGSEVTADLAIVRMLRMSQIASGYVGNDEDELVPLGDNVRMRCLKDTLEDVTGSVIIWGRYNCEIDAIREMLGERDAVYYDGRTSDEDKARALVKFQREGSARFFVAKPSAAGEGLTLHRAKTVIYVSNSFSWRERAQSEDRAHRAGMNDEPVLYIDLVARNTLDGYILRALRKKRNLSAEITGDNLPSWA